ncbi:hypothetical protein BSKO_07426 [Bryopsis sp. KO-2023]|nr:hypothetical protein BSKO_07426 [Bryopsis sp. KO-2023]
MCCVEKKHPKQGICSRAVWFRNLHRSLRRNFEQEVVRRFFLRAVAASSSSRSDGFGFRIRSFAGWSVMDGPPLHVRGKLDGAWYPIDFSRSQVIFEQNGPGILRIRKNDQDASEDELVGVEEMYKRIRCASRLATTADVGLFLEGLFIVGLAEMNSGTKKWCDCEIVKRMPEQGEYEVRVKWHNAGEGPLEDRQPVNFVLDLKGGPCIQLKSNRDVGSHPRFRHWMSLMETSREVDNSNSVNGDPVVVDLTTPTPGNSPQSSPAIVMPPQQRARLRLEGRSLPGKITSPGDPRGFRPVFDTRQSDGQEVVDLLEDEGMSIEGKSMASLQTRGFRRAPNRRGPDVQQLPNILHGSTGQKSARKSGGAVVVKPESSTSLMEAGTNPRASTRPHFFKDKRDGVDTRKRLPSQSDQYGGPQPPRFGGLVSSGSQNLLAEETLDFEDMQGYMGPGNRIDLTCEENRIQEPMRWGLAPQQMFSNPSNMRPYSMNAYPQSFRPVQGGGLATDLRGNDTSLLGMGVQGGSGAWQSPQPPPGRGLFPPIEPSGQPSDILAVFSQPRYPYSRMQHPGDKRLGAWASGNQNFDSEVGVDGKESVDTDDGPKKGDLSEVSRLGLLYLATCCFREENHPDHLKLAKDAQVLDGDRLKRRKISWNDI